MDYKSRNSGKEMFKDSPNNCRQRERQRKRKRVRGLCKRVLYTNQLQHFPTINSLEESNLCTFLEQVLICVLNSTILSLLSVNFYLASVDVVKSGVTEGHFFYVANILQGKHLLKNNTKNICLSEINLR